MREYQPKPKAQNDVQLYGTLDLLGFSFHAIIIMTKLKFSHKYCSKLIYMLNRQIKILKSVKTFTLGTNAELQNLENGEITYSESKATHKWKVPC